MPWPRLPQNPSPAGTQRSTDPSRERRNEILRALKALILVAALVWVGYKTVGAVRAIRSGELALHIRPAWLAASAGIVLLAYSILIWSWLYILTGLSGQSLPFLSGARIWFASSLASLLPGRIWGMLQMTTMAVEEGISPLAAGAASVINAAVNIACGLAVGVIAGSPILAEYLGGNAWLAWLVAGLAILGVCLLPVLIPIAFRIARERFNASVPTERPRARVLVVSVVANIAAWILYGAAFLCLANGILEGVRGSVMDHTAAFATSYVIGYLFIFVPGGLGVREDILQRVLLTANLATQPQALALVVVSRLWLLIIQVLPALVFLAYRRRPRNEKDPAAG